MKRLVTALVAVLTLLAGVATVGAAPVSATEEERCAGGTDRDPDVAKANYGRDCGQPFLEHLRYTCGYIDGAGYECTGPKAPAPAFVPPPVPKPRIMQASTPTYWAVSPYISLIWHSQRDYTDGVNVYRNEQYIGTVRSPGNVFNDVNGRVGDRYELIAFRDGEYSSKSKSITATSPNGIASAVKARVELRAGVATSVLYWGDLRSDLTGLWIYRNDSGYIVAPGQGTRIGYVSKTTHAFVDRNPVRGASYGVVAVRQDGTQTPVVTIRPDYSRPAIPLMARCAAFSESCLNPFDPSDTYGPPKFDIDIVPVDPTLPDPNSNLGSDPTSGLFSLTSEISRPGDQPVAEVPLNGLTDPDNDGLSVLSDNDNDNDGIPTWEDQNDTNPGVGRPPRPSNPGGGGGDGPQPNSPDNNYGWGNDPGGEYGDTPTEEEEEEAPSVNDGAPGFR